MVNWRMVSRVRATLLSPVKGLVKRTVASGSAFGRAGLEDFLDEFAAVGVVDEAVLVQVGEKR